MKRFLLQLFFLFPFLSIAQVNFKKGYLITNKGTLRGYIDYREREKNPSNFKFAKSLDEKTVQYGFQDCSEVGIEGITTYERHFVTISQSETELSRLSIGLDTTVKRDTVFLKVLSTGPKLTLYTYTDNIKTRFFAKKNGELQPTELILSVYLNSESNKSIVYKKQYHMQLLNIDRDFYGDAAADEKSIQLIGYSNSDLIRFAEKINKQKHEKSKFNKTWFFVGAGLNVANIRYSGENILTEPGTITKTSYLPMFSVGLDIPANPAIGKIVYRVELNYSVSKAEIYNAQQHDFISFVGHTFSQHNFAIIPQVAYHFYNKKNMQLFFSGGMGLNFPSYKDNLTVMTNSFRKETTPAPNQIEFEGFYYSIPVKAGLVLKKRFEFSAGYFFNSSTTSYNSYNLIINRITLGLNYRFIRQKI